VDETYVRVKGRWTYLYRAVDSTGATIDFLLAVRRDAAAAKRFFQNALCAPGHPRPRLIKVDGNPSYPKVVAELSFRYSFGYHHPLPHEAVRHVHIVGIYDIVALHAVRLVAGNLQANHPRHSIPAHVANGGAARVTKLWGVRPCSSLAFLAATSKVHHVAFENWRGARIVVFGLAFFEGDLAPSNSTCGH
jgi:hypothetical protein